jgi:hypothetical protein
LLTLTLMAKFVSRRISVCGAGSGFCWTGIDCLASSTFCAFTGNRFGVSVGVVVCPACTTVDELPDVVVAVREPLVPVTTPVDDAVVPAAVVCVVSVPDAAVDDAAVDDAAVDDAVVDAAAPVVAVADVELPVVGPATLVVADEDVAPPVVVVAGATVVVTAGAAVVVIGAAVVVTAGAAVVTAGAAVVVITGGAVVVITGAGATVVCGAKVCTGASCVGSGAGGGGASCVGGGASCVGGGASYVGSCTVRGAGAGVVVVTGKALAGTTTPLVSAVNEMATPEATTTIACRPRQIRSVPVIVATLSPRPWRCHAPSEMRGE